MTIPLRHGQSAARPRISWRATPVRGGAALRRREGLICICLIITFLTSVGRAEETATTQPAHYTKAQIDQSIGRGVEFLVKDQQPAGFWGTGLETHGTEVYSMVPGTLDSFRIGTSALCVIALREMGERTAHDKGLEYLLTVPDARRDTGDLIYNTWAHIYLLQAMAEEMPHNPDPRIRKVAQREIQDLVRFSTYMGGWNYYDFEAQTQHPSMGPTSFGTAAGLVALYEARQAGLDVPEKLTRQAVRRLEEMRLPNGVYLYGSDYKYIPRLPANRPKGAVGRTQTANYALKLWGWDKLDRQKLRESLDLLTTRAGCSKCLSPPIRRSMPRSSSPLCCRTRSRMARGGISRCGISTSRTGRHLRS